MSCRLALIAGLVCVLSSCGHDRPTDAERVLVPLVPTALPSGYVLSRVDERPRDDQGGRWIDITFVPEGNDRIDPTGSVTLGQFLDIEPSSAFFGEGGDRVTVRGLNALCDGTFLRWTEKPSAQMAIGGGDLSCKELREIANSLTEVTVATWRQYERSGRDE